MAKILDMPKLSPTMEEGVLQAWHKNEGDSVAVDDLLAEVETDKATMEFRAFDKGTLLKILVPAGTNVKLGQAVAILGNAGEDVSALVAQAGAAAPEGGAAAAEAQPPQPPSPPKAPSPSAGREAAQTAPGTQGGEVRAIEPRTQTVPPDTARTPSGPVAPQGSVLSRTERDAGDGAALEAGSGGANGGRVLASPYVRKVAREKGVDLAGARGSGEHGRILPQDLDSLRARGAGAGAAPGALARAPQAPLGPPALAQPEVRPLSPMRKTIARRLTEAKRTVPHFYLTIDVDAEALVAFRERVNAELAPNGKRASASGADGEGDKPLKVSLNDMLIKACAAALVRVPECNAQFTEEAILVHRRVDISVAVAIPEGLITPVVRDADKKSLSAIAREVRDLAARARAKKLKPEEFSDGTFSISNLGMFGIDEFSAVINPPEGAILAVGQVREEPVVKDGAVQPGKKLAMTLSCDHRVVDGAVGAAFLAELRALLEHPMRILTG
jgi:pyruvate dehydrogenase E2 component (dihydrolipoamide acetyltransferase)